MAYTGLTINGMRADKRINDTCTAFNMDAALKFENVALKEGTSIIDPVFIIKKPTVTALPKFNYLYCDDFKRYYWIKDTINQAGRTNGSSYFMELHCHVDVLGSWKSVIGNVPCYVRYCSDINWNNVVDLTQDDDRLSADVPVAGISTDLLNSTMANYFSNFKLHPDFDDTSPTFSLTLGQLGPGATSTQIYVMDKLNFSSFFTQIWNLSDFEAYVKNGGSGDNLNKFFEWQAEKLGGVLLEPASFVKEIRLLPFYFDSALGDEDAYPNGHPEAGVSVGKIVTMCTGKRYRSNTEYLYDVYDVEINLTGLGSPDASEDGVQYKFLRRKKYLKLTLSSPFGDLDISSDSFALTEDKVELRVKVAIESTTGDIGIHVYCKATNELLGKISGNISLDMTHLISPGGYKQNAVAGQLRAAGNIADIGGAALGGLIGSIIPGAGTAAGAAVGSTIGHTIGSIASNAANTAQSVSSTGGSIMSSNYSFIDYILQDLDLDESGEEPEVSIDFTAFFKVIATVFVPAVCIDETTYQSYALLYGYPCNKMVDDFTGLGEDGEYIQCAQYNVLGSTGSANMYPEEIQEINQFLNSGIYWNTTTLEE